MRSIYRRLLLALRIARLAASVGEAVQLFIWSVYATLRRAVPALPLIRLRIRVRFLEDSYPVELRDISDVWEMKDVLLDAEYDMLDIKDPSIVIDLGSNIGISSVFLARKYPGAKVFAIEPNPRVSEQLAYIVAPHANIETHRFALAAEDGTARLFVGRASLGSSLSRKEGDEEMEVEAVSAASLLARLGVERADLLKFDIEGAERFLFEQGPDPRVSAYLGEMHYDRMPLSGEAVRERFSEFTTSSFPAGRPDREILYLRKPEA